MRKLLYIVAVLLGVVAVSSSCITDELSYSPSDVLTFSRDTVSFDTVFTDLGTPTARLVISNRAKKGVNITSIRVKNPNSHFSINIDGVSGKEFRDVEIWGRDSIYAFIECYIPTAPTNAPERVEDELEFVTNGVTQTVLLEAYGQNIKRLRGVTVTDELTLDNELPVVVFDSLVVAPGATLNIRPGTQVLFHDKARLVVQGRLNAVGEAGRMIQLRGDRLDNLLPDIGYDLLAGQWQGVRIEAGSFDNRMEYVDMRSTVSGVEVDSCGVTDRQKLLIVNSWLHNSQGSVLSSRHARVDAYGVCFSDAANAVVSLEGGVHEFVQCTFANYYLFSAISQPIVLLSHLLPEDLKQSSMPLMRARFENSIIYGLSKDIAPGDLKGSQVLFRNVSFKSKGENDGNFINCLWDCNPDFLTDRPKYIFNYRVREGSPVIGKGDASFLNSYTQTDMDGASRTASGAPTLGAYAVPVAEKVE